MMSQKVSPSDKIAEKHVQSTLVISKPKGLPEIYRDTRTSTYQISKIEKII